MHNIEKLKYSEALVVVTPQDFQSMFVHISILYMKDLTGMEKFIDLFRNKSITISVELKLYCTKNEFFH